MKAPSFAGSWCSADGCLVCESPIARHVRWDQEYEAARRARTDAFYAQRESAADGIVPGESATGRGLIAGSGTSKGSSKGDDDEQETMYTEMLDEASIGVPLRAEADTHLSEKLQGRLCAAALWGCCCAGCILVTHGVAL